ncbi:MAG: hypothetical protein ACOX5R_06910 [bacterium]|jgi:hypothetical protein
MTDYFLHGKAIGVCIVIFVTLVTSVTYGEILLHSTLSEHERINTSSDWYPPHLRGAKAYNPPTRVVDFARKYGVEKMVFVDDHKKCDRSLRRGNDIFINTRTSFWDSMLIKPWHCSTPSEAILQRVLHEIGHVFFNHSGDPDIKSTANGLVLDPLEDEWDSLRGKEGEAWRFCFYIRDQKPEEYQTLLNEIEEWYKTHQYEKKDWLDTPAAQWKRWYKEDLHTDLWKGVPTWVRTEFANVKDLRTLAKN